jgi:hypothetical protein
MSIGPLTVKTARVRAPSIPLSNGSLVFVTQASALFTESVSLSMPESVDLAIRYGQPIAENIFCFLACQTISCIFDTLRMRPRAAARGGAFYHRNMNDVSSMNSFASAV